METIDLKSISRLESTEEAFDVSCEIYNIIMNNLPDGQSSTDEYGDKELKPQSEVGNGDESIDSPSKCLMKNFKKC